MEFGDRNSPHLAKQSQVERNTTSIGTFFIRDPNLRDIVHSLPETVDT